MIDTWYAKPQYPPLCLPHPCDYLYVYACVREEEVSRQEKRLIEITDILSVRIIIVVAVFVRSPFLSSR